jgi:hypothetical protein
MWQTKLKKAIFVQGGKDSLVSKVLSANS